MQTQELASWTLTLVSKIQSVSCHTCLYCWVHNQIVSHTHRDFI